MLQLDVNVLKIDGVNYFLWDPTFNLSEMMRSCKYFTLVSKTPPLTYYWLNTDTIHNYDETKLTQPCKSNDLVIQY